MTEMEERRTVTTNCPACGRPWRGFYYRGLIVRFNACPGCAPWLYILAASQRGRLTKPKEVSNQRT